MKNRLFKRRGAEIPYLPTKEVPEAGYRAVYDKVVPDVHPDEFVRPDGRRKTTSELVLEIIEAALEPPAPAR
ncbi:MAG: hypothetical protein LLG08_01805 [Actinomycetia bacterium]|nr:hypothetical protein [Actinomycetes bacterium]